MIVKDDSGREIVIRDDSGIINYLELIENRFFRGPTGGGTLEMITKREDCEEDVRVTTERIIGGERYQAEYCIPKGTNSGVAVPFPTKSGFVRN